ncbi:universal stress protein [Streptomyces rugosispiralis]|uniref:Universal stress protein n=1 Tax=Streptomyces rugosispiralis TaxID=2967341 RepID=A0ABT1UTE6_9ACTN|nr:universal stress protein [Streptomyces rugosispiralis]MCQ8188390.1 universal stress protein [Streptomyces rugosispiralis]
MGAPITVGIDGFAESPPAAHWAAREALLRDLRLRLIHAWPPPSPPAPALPHEDDRSYWSQRLLSDLVGELRDTHPGLRVTAELVPRETVPALLDAARDAEMLVLGSRGRGTPGGFLLGSTGRQVLAHGEHPVIMVHADDRPLTADVTVGVSLRQPNEEALRFAFDAAARRGGVLRAVHAGAHGPGAEETAGTEEAARAVETAGAAEEPGAEGALDAALRPWRERYPGVPVAEAFTAERPALGVMHTAPGSGLLVLGRDKTEPGPVPHLGSVIHAAVHHAPCPVAVVPRG